VQPQTGWVLFDEAGESEWPADVKRIAEGVSFAGSLDVLRRMATNPPGQLLVLLGYAGWGPGQLETELAEGAWLLAPVERSLVFDTEPEDMWAQVVRSLGIEPATLVASRGVH
jgi:putative transcriptional regulator